MAAVQWDKSVDLLIVDPRLRLCSRLLTFGGRLIDFLPASPVSIPMTQEELATASNMSRSTVYHLLGELVVAGAGSTAIVVRVADRRYGGEVGGPVEPRHDRCRPHLRHQGEQDEQQTEDGRAP